MLEFVKTFQGGTLFWRKEGERGEGGGTNIITVISLSLSLPFTPPESDNLDSENTRLRAFAW